MKHAAYVTVFDGSGQFMTTIPTSRDVGYKYFTVFDGSKSIHVLAELDLVERELCWILSPRHE